MREEAKRPKPTSWGSGARCRSKPQGDIQRLGETGKLRELRLPAASEVFRAALGVLRPHYGARRISQQAEPAALGPGPLLESRPHSENRKAKKAKKAKAKDGKRQNSLIRCAYKVIRLDQMPFHSSAFALAALAFAKQLDGTELSQGVQAKASGLRKGHALSLQASSSSTLINMSKITKTWGRDQQIPRVLRISRPAIGLQMRCTTAPQASRRDGTRLVLKKGSEQRPSTTQSGRNSLLVVLHRKMP